MNYTESGIIASGAPHSRARYAAECKAGLESPCLLLLTEEGNEMARRFFRAQGCDPATMPPTIRAEVLMRRELYQFLAGVDFALNLK